MSIPAGASQIATTINRPRGAQNAQRRIKRGLYARSVEGDVDAVSVRQRPNHLNCILRQRIDYARSPDPVGGNAARRRNLTDDDLSRTLGKAELHQGEADRASAGDEDGPTRCQPATADSVVRRRDRFNDGSLGETDLIRDAK
ncbi:hypothetical protein Y900_029320 [Mycolicibacterium aromaticivorans JS19b1 = JCM 16368]|uniref:Uncharacterized protein n=1 Tax=Mycolicibacterium aromaticivorans JS19b1 = JCM 16368 TaxID=1440774 RepID=A0A064CAL5_9MYCO|nr:hypothetical protein Y900_029320 [Mycolicibacterium aromaticivorans JS19b1 = JCM 16368]